MEEYGEGVTEQGMPGGCLSPPDGTGCRDGAGRETPIDERSVTARPIVLYPIDSTNQCTCPAREVAR